MQDWKVVEPNPAIGHSASHVQLDKLIVQPFSSLKPSNTTGRLQTLVIINSALKSGLVPVFTLPRGELGLKPVLRFQNIYQNQTGLYRTSLGRFQVGSKLVETNFQLDWVQKLVQLT